MAEIALDGLLKLANVGQLFEDLVGANSEGGWKNLRKPQILGHRSFSPGSGKPAETAAFLISRLAPSSPSPAAESGVRHIKLAVTQLKSHLLALKPAIKSLKWLPLY